MVSFDNEYYAKVMAEHGPLKSDRNAAVANSILLGLCILSESIDGLAKAVERVAESQEGGD